VIRVEVAKVGESPQIFATDEVEGLMRTDGTQLEPAKTRTVALGDAERDPNKQAPTAPPTLRNPGETLPQEQGQESPGAMKPVRFPKSTSIDGSAGQPNAPAGPAIQPAKPQEDEESPEDAHPLPASTPAPPSQR
jgi:hypothetical protein